MGQRLSHESQQADFVMPPMYTTGATGNTGFTTGAGNTTPLGQTYPPTGPSIFAVNTTPTVLDLTSICGTGAKARVVQGTDDYDPDPIGHYFTMQADGDDIYYVFSDSVGGGLNMGVTAVTAIDGGTITGATGKASAPLTSTGGTLGGGTIGAVKLPNNTSKDFKLPVGTPTVGKPYDNADPIGIYSPARYLTFRSNTGLTVYLRVWQSSP